MKSKMYKELEKKYAKNLKKIRKKKNISGYELNKVLGKSKEKSSIISKYETGKFVPGVVTAYLISQKLEEPMESFFE